MPSVYLLNRQKIIYPTLNNLAFPRTEKVCVWGGVPSLFTAFENLNKRTEPPQQAPQTAYSLYFGYIVIALVLEKYEVFFNTVSSTCQGGARPFPT